MSQRKHRHKTADPQQFVEMRDLPQPGIVREFWYFLRHNKKWWLLPTIVALLILSAVVVLASTAAAPFIYTLF